MAKSKAAAALPQSAVAVDLVVLTVRGGELCVLTVRRGIPPYQGKFALPGGFVLPDEDLEAAAYRELAEEAGLKKRAVTLEQLRTFGAPGRDPRGRVVSVAYLAMGAGLPDPRGGSDALSAQFEPVSEYLSRRAGPSPWPSTIRRSSLPGWSARGRSSNTPAWGWPSVRRSSRWGSCGRSMRRCGM